MSLGYEYKVAKDKEDFVTVSVKVTPQKFAEYQDLVFAELAKDVQIPGFRKGNGPKAQVASKIGEKLFSETLKTALSEISAEIVDEEELSPVTNVDYDVQKLSDEDGLEYTFKFVNYPEITLGDLTKLKVEKPAVEIKPSDIDEVMGRLFKGDEAGKGKDASAPSAEAIKQLGIEGVETAAQLREHIENRLVVIKQQEIETKYQQDLLDAAVAASKVPVAEALLEQQAENLVHDYLHRIEHLDVNVDEFLQAQGLDHDKLKEQKKQEAKGRIAADLVSNAIVKKYELIPTAEEIEDEIASISDETIRQSYDSTNGRRYILSVLIQQRAMAKLLELNKDSSKAPAKAKAKKS